MKRTHKQNGKYARNKGLNWERKIANELKDIFPKAKRHLESQSDEAMLGMDLENTEPYAFQLKCLKNYAPINRIEEIKADDLIPVLLTKGDRKRPVACLYFDDFKRILEILHGRAI